MPPAAGKGSVRGVGRDRWRIEHHEVSALPVSDILAFFDKLELPPRERLIARQVLKEIKSASTSSTMWVWVPDARSGRLNTFRRRIQRIRLATQIGSSLMGVLYILDEPSIGLHQRDSKKLLDALKRLRDLGNTLIVVEHDHETMQAADWIIDIGPGRGRRRPDRGRRHLRYHLRGGGVFDRALPVREAADPVPSFRRKPRAKAVKVIGARRTTSRASM